MNPSFICIWVNEQTHLLKHASHIECWRKISNIIISFIQLRLQAGWDHEHVRLLFKTIPCLSSLIHSPHLLVWATNEWRVRSSTSCNHWLSLAKIALKVCHAGRNHSLVANTSRCGERFASTSSPTHPYLVNYDYRLGGARNMYDCYSELYHAYSLLYTPHTYWWGPPMNGEYHQHWLQPMTLTG